VATSSFWEFSNGPSFHLTFETQPSKQIKIIGECGRHLEMVGNHYHYSSLILQKIKFKKTNSDMKTYDMIA
jgi:hypothetical protein